MIFTTLVDHDSFLDMVLFASSTVVGAVTALCFFGLFDIELSSLGIFLAVAAVLSFAIGFFTDEPISNVLAGLSDGLSSAGGVMFIGHFAADYAEFGQEVFPLEIWQVVAYLILAILAAGACVIFQTLKV